MTEKITDYPLASFTVPKWRILPFLGLSAFEVIVGFQDSISRRSLQRFGFLSHGHRSLRILLNDDTK